MLDLLMALALTGVILAIATVSFGGAIRTYRRDAMARHVLTEIRNVQNLAATRGGVFGFQWGADPSINRPPTQYRIVRDTTKTCSLPAEGAAQDGTNVIRSWVDLEGEYPAVTIQSVKDAANQPVGEIMFDALGASVNTCGSVSFPLTITIADGSDRTRSIKVQGAGGTQLR